MTEHRPTYGNETEFICPNCHQSIGRIVKIQQWYCLVITFKAYIEAVTDCPLCHRIFEYRQPEEKKEQEARYTIIIRLNHKPSGDDRMKPIFDKLKSRL